MISRKSITLSLTCMIALASFQCSAINLRPLLMLAAQLNNRKVIIPTLLVAGAAYLLSKLKFKKFTLIRPYNVTKDLPKNINSLTLENTRGKVILEQCGKDENPSLTFFTEQTDTDYEKFTISLRGIIRKVAHTKKLEPTITNNNGNITVTDQLKTGLWYRFQNFVYSRHPKFIHYRIRVPVTTKVTINTKEDAQWDDLSDTIYVNGFLRREALDQELDIRTNPGNTIKIQNTNLSCLSCNNSITRNGRFRYKYCERKSKKLGTNGEPSYNVQFEFLNDKVTLRPMEDEDIPAVIKTAKYSIR